MSGGVHCRSGVWSSRSEIGSSSDPPCFWISSSLVNAYISSNVENGASFARCTADASDVEVLRLRSLLMRYSTG